MVGGKGQAEGQMAWLAERLERQEAIAAEGPVERHATSFGD